MVKASEKIVEVEQGLEAATRDKNNGWARARV